MCVCVIKNRTEIRYMEQLCNHFAVPSAYMLLCTSHCSSSEHLNIQTKSNSNPFKCKHRVSALILQLKNICVVIKVTSVTLLKHALVNEMQIVVAFC